MPEPMIDPSKWTVTVGTDALVDQPNPVQKLQRLLDRRAYEMITRKYDEDLESFLAPSKAATITVEEAAKSLGFDTVVPSRPPILPPYSVPGWISDYPQRFMQSAPQAPPAKRETPKKAALDFTKYSYMKTVHNPEKLLGLAKDHLAGIEYDTLVGTGLSGTLAVAELARKLGKRYLIVRKPNDGSHSTEPAEGTLGTRWVFVDDLVGSGRTLSRVWDVIHDQCYYQSFDTEYVGAFLYSDMRFVSASDRRTAEWLHFSKHKKYEPDLSW